MNNKMDIIYHVEDYGTLFEGENVTDEQKWSNTKTIQKTVDTAGQNGGGTVVIPEGTYYLNGNQDAGDVPGQPESMGTACLYIQYGNIILKGAGVDKTYLITPGEYKVINNTVERVHGIRIIPVPGTKIETLIFKDFDLYGCFHGNGNISWPANTETGDGWDITHKGFCFFDGGVGDVTLENICMHGYSGEIFYCGASLKSLTLRYCKSYDTNGQCFNGQSHDTLVEYCQLGDPDYISNMWIEYANINMHKEFGDATFAFRNCYFTHNNHGGVSFNEGHNDNYRLLFENNIFNLSGGINQNRAHVACFVFDGGSSGPTLIRNNTFISNDGAISAFNSDCWEPRHRHKDENIIIENNRFTGFRSIFTFAGAYGAPLPERMIDGRWEKQLKNIVFRNNTVDAFCGEDERPSFVFGTDKETMIDYIDPRWQSKCMPNLKSIVIENNTFNNAVSPLLRDHYGSVPAFKNNLYNNLKLKENFAYSYSAIQSVSNENNRVVPVFEFLRVKASEPARVRLRTHNPMEMNIPAYADGYEVLVGGEKGTAPITFIPDVTNTWKTPTVITENNYMRIRFDREVGKWALIELITGELTYNGKGADTSVLIGADTSEHIGTFDTVIDSCCL